MIAETTSAPIVISPIATGLRARQLTFDWGQCESSARDWNESACAEQPAIEIRTLKRIPFDEFEPGDVDDVTDESAVSGRHEERQGLKQIHVSPAAQRFGQPVRIGVTMHRLLRSYGITEEEIAQGISDYALKQHWQKRA
ncbi:MAG: hypothetical protein KDB22_24890 [Planctomycetales bacterium]|nr:hypothetical protein [Planctomycetales bacterium]